MANVTYNGKQEAITCDGTDQIVTLLPDLFKSAPVAQVTVEVVSGTGVQIALDEAITGAHFTRVPGTSAKVTYSYNISLGIPVLHIKGTSGDKVVISY
jgi:hypothetical protein